MLSRPRSPAWIAAEVGGKQKRWKWRIAPWGATEKERHTWPETKNICDVSSFVYKITFRALNVVANTYFQVRSFLANHTNQVAACCLSREYHLVSIRMLQACKISTTDATASRSNGSVDSEVHQKSAKGSRASVRMKPDQFLPFCRKLEKKPCKKSVKRLLNASER